MYYMAFLFLVVIRPLEANNRCSRQKSRIVRNVINSKMVLPFELLDAELPISCPLHPHRDMYRIQEDNKIMESMSKWTCNYCGKAFVAEDFVDKHFDNRHMNEIVAKENIVCLADYCDVFRCDIIAGVRKPDYWDFALCMEDDMKEILEECNKLMEDCIPKYITVNETKHFRDLLQDAVCSYLTCNKFWEIPKKETPDGKIALYVVMTLLILFALLVYYCVFYQFYYTDTFSDSIVYDPTPRGRHRMVHPSYQEVRQRTTAKRGSVA
ncbi:hypothetical protein SNE40_007730 [Patella caerulea]|uniref:C2H2-type domain-containing protein n=1 Tax=Patella caerulea TaxID=87958 RepID=A0AAN8JZ60_PATCE